MSKVSKAVLKNCTSLTAAELMGVKTIQPYFFYEGALNELQIPSSVEIIGENAFTRCYLKKIDFSNTASLKEIKEYAFNQCSDGVTLEVIGLENINPYCKIHTGTLDEFPFVYNTLQSYLYAANGKILLTCSKLTGNFAIPDVINLSACSCGGRGDNGDSTTTKLVIPDTVELVNDEVFINRTALTNITIGSSVRYIGKNLYTLPSAATLIFRQPSGMYVELPIAGQSTGLAYNKESRAIAIYTDNECIKNYDWSADNATVTFYPLADAPT